MGTESFCIRRLLRDEDGFTDQNAVTNNFLISSKILCSYTGASRMAFGQELVPFRRCTYGNNVLIALPRAIETVFENCACNQAFCNANYIVCPDYRGADCGCVIQLYGGNR